MNRQNKINMLVMYERFCGGETRATEEIMQELKKYPQVSISSYALHPLIHTDFVRFFYWIITSVLRWIYIIGSHRHTDWIYTTTYTAGVAALLCKPFLHYRIAWHIHGNRVPPMHTQIRGKTYITQMIKHTVVSFFHSVLVRHADEIFAPTIEGKQLVISWHTDADEQKIHIIPNGVDQKRFHPISGSQRLLIRKKYRLNNHHHVFLSVGRVEKQKGYEQLLLVMTHLYKSDPYVRLYIVFPSVLSAAEDGYKHVLMNLIHAYHLDAIVQMIENPRHIEKYYHLSDITLSLSLLEFFPLTMLESMASGTIFMGTHIGEMKRFLPSVDSRLLFASSDADKQARQIRRMLSLSEAEKTTIRNKAQQQMKLFTWNHSTKKIFYYLIKHT